MSAITFDDRPTALRRPKEGATAPKLADPMPPCPPANNAPVGYGRAHDVVRWHRDGRVSKTRHQTKEEAFSFAEASHYATIWKWMVMDGREIVARRLVDEPTEVTL